MNTPLRWLFILLFILSPSKDLWAQEAPQSDEAMPASAELEPTLEASPVEESQIALEDAETEDAWRAPKHRLFYKNALISRLNPSGLQNGFELAYRYRLFESESILLKESFIGVALKPMISPAFTRIGVALQAQPLAILYLEASWNWMAWYGVLGHPRTFEDSSGDYSDSGIAEAAESGEPNATGGWELDLVAELRAKVGPLVIKNRTTLIRSQLTEAEPHNHALYYDPLYDLLRPRSGWSLTNDADLLVMLLDDQLIVGARYSLGYAMWPGDEGGQMNHRFGPLVAYRFFMEPGNTFDAPTLFTLVQWHLEHPHRTGADVSQAFPYLVVGFAFQGDLL